MFVDQGFNFNFSLLVSHPSRRSAKLAFAQESRVFRELSNERGLFKWINMIQVRICLFP